MDDEVFVIFSLRNVFFLNVIHFQLQISITNVLTSLFELTIAFQINLETSKLHSSTNHNRKCN